MNGPGIDEAHYPEPLYPGISVPLVGEDGNAFAILARARRAMQDAGIDYPTRDRFYTDATSGDYAHLLDTVQRWFGDDTF